MSRDIPINAFPRPPLGGVLIERNALQKNLSFRRLEQQARQRAKQLVKDAQKDAQELQEQACREGFQQGMLYALQQVATYLSDSNLALAHWQKQLEQQAREMLGASVSHPETLFLVFDEWLSGLSAADMSLNIVLPEAMKGRHADVISRVARENGSMVHIGYHPGTNVIFRCGEDIAEFSPAEFTDVASHRLLMRNHPALNESCCRLSRDALAWFTEYCQKLKDENIHSSQD
ncbi:hypothetical protein XS46_004522 [Salmonella enterica subsp. enterica]|nr:hypothetical protein [Salmonella enterica subsp. enterica serovar Pensacola]EDS6428883.1 hypothetical protein [Salmonella enterica subsp. enterica]